MTRFKDEAALQEVLRRRGYKIREQFTSGENVNTNKQLIEMRRLVADPDPAFERCNDHYDKQGRQCVLHKHHDSPHRFEGDPLLDATDEYYNAPPITVDLSPADHARALAMRPLYDKIKADIDKPEADVLAECIAYLQKSKRVAWCKRLNTGGVWRNGQYVAFGWTGASDIIGQHRDGRFFAVECKRPGKVPTSDQWDFLSLVVRNNGIGLVATDVSDLYQVFG